MRKSVPVQVILRFPATEEGQKALACRAAGAWADFATDTVCGLDCPVSQKLALLDAVIGAVRQERQAGVPGA